MKLYIDTKPMRNANAGRGVGQYTRMLIDAIKKYTDISIVDTIQAADVVHYPFFDLFFLTLPIFKSKPTVVTIHDVIPLRYPQQYPKGVRGLIKQYIQTFALGNTRAIVTDSDCSTDDVVQLLGQPKEKVKTVYLAPDPRFTPASRELVENVKNKYALSAPYFLYVGDINYNKNLPALLTTFSELPKNYLLVLVSNALRRDNPAATFLWHIIDSLGIEPRLRVLTNVVNDPLNELCGLYSGAFWYIQPSLYEGFGLPVLEAQACGCPVLSTEGGSLKEITYHSCMNFDSFKQLPLEALRSKYINLGIKNRNRFNWENTANLMKEVYEKIAII
jgi:glycosyltransferase involved in cell wall biosynthesis